MIGDQWLLVPDAAVTAAGPTRITTGANRGQWDLTTALALAAGTGAAGWTNLTGTSRFDVTAAQLAGPLQVMILTGQGADAASASDWLDVLASGVRQRKLTPPTPST